MVYSVDFTTGNKGATVQEITKYKAVQNIANALAREAGYRVCTEIQFTTKEKEMVFHGKNGYRKLSTGEYSEICNGNHIHYPNPETTVFIPIHLLELWASENLKKKRGW